MQTKKPVPETTSMKENAMGRTPDHDSAEPYNAASQPTDDSARGAPPSDGTAGNRHAPDHDAARDGVACDDTVGNAWSGASAPTRLVGRPCDPYGRTASLGGLGDPDGRG